MTLRLLLLLIAITIAFAIYPDDHWQYSEKLTTSNFDETVKKHVDAGKTFFVRWIASEGWGWWRKQAPAWNTIVKRFASNNDVEFGDVNLSQERVTGTHNPGSGGWPTIRYFNKETGYEGGSYKQKTSGAICDELGKEENMEEYVLTYGSTYLCAVTTKTGCSANETEYIQRFAQKSVVEIQSQLTRLQSTQQSVSKLKDKDKTWIRQRISILKQLLVQTDDASQAPAAATEL